MNKLIQLLCALCVLGCIAGASVASPILSLVPSTSKIHPPESFHVDLLISGLQSSDPSTLLGAFDFTILYNPDIVTLLTIGSTFGTGLGDPTNPMQTVVGADASSPGSFRFFEVSLLEASSTSCIFCIGPYLQDLQSDSFTLASLLFFSPSAPAGAGITNFLLPRDLTVLSNANGDPIMDFGIRNASVRIAEPNGMLLILTAMLAIVVVGKVRRPVAAPLLSLILLLGGSFVPGVSYSAVQLSVPPQANYQMTARERIYYKLVVDAEGKSQPVEVDKSYSYLAGDSGARARVGHYSSFGPNGVNVTTGISYDYWVEKSYYIFNVSSDPYPLEATTNYLVFDTSHYFGETDTVEVNLIQLPWNVFQFYDLGQAGNALEEIVRVISQADQQPPVGGESKGVVLATEQVGIGSSNRFSTPLNNLLVVRDSHDNPAYYSYGTFALRANDALDFSACGGIKGYTLTEDPVTFELSLSDQNGNRLSGFDSGVVLNFCVNGWTTAGYGFRVEQIRFDGEIPPTAENPVCDLGILSGHNSSDTRFCAINEGVSFYVCQGDYSAVYLEQPLAALGGTPVSYWAANQVVNLKYLVDWGDGPAQSQIGSCETLTHRYTAPGTYSISVSADFDVKIFNVLGQLISTDHKSSKELGRETIILSPAQALAKAAFTIQPILGDVNHDESVDVIDVSQILAEIQSPTSDWRRFDINGDGLLNIADARKVVTLFSNPRGLPNAPSFPQTLNGRYAASVVPSSTGSHYGVWDVRTGNLLFTTHAQFDTPNDVKVGLFSADGKRFAAAYHYGNLGPQTWIGLWEVPTGEFLGFRLTSGYLNQLPANFSSEGFEFQK